MVHENHSLQLLVRHFNLLHLNVGPIVYRVRLVKLILPQKFDVRRESIHHVH